MAAGKVSRVLGIKTQLFETYCDLVDPREAVILHGGGRIQDKTDVCAEL